MTDANPFNATQLLIAQAVAEVLAGVEVDDAAGRRGLKGEAVKAALEANDGAIRPRSRWDAVDLITARFTDLAFTVDVILPTGLAMIAANPKVGKTRMVVQLAVAVALGVDALGYTTTQTPVLALALEDGARRLRRTVTQHPDHTQLQAGQLTIATTSPRLDDGGLDRIRDWLHHHRRGLIIIDVLERVRQKQVGNRSVYRADYGDLAPLQDMAVRYQATILIVHHTNQLADVPDPFMKISGSTGLIGAVDVMMLLERRRGDNVGRLTVAGRDIDDVSVALAFDQGWWTPTNMPGALVALSAEMRALWQWLGENEGATITDAAKVYAGGRGEGAAYRAMCRLEELELVDRLDGHERARKDAPVRWVVVPLLPKGMQGFQ